jgi:hypothetical protein
MIIELNDSLYKDEYVIHSVESAGQTNGPRDYYKAENSCIALKLLQESYKHSHICSHSPNIIYDYAYFGEEYLRIPGAKMYKHIIGSLYYVIVQNENPVMSAVLVDINTQKVIRDLVIPSHQAFPFPAAYRFCNSIIW